MEDSNPRVLPRPDEAAAPPPAAALPAPMAQKRPKRSRVALACRRCKARKQKCNGAEPSCSTCTRLNLSCHYAIPNHSRPGAAKIYIGELEDRVAELEMSLAELGNARAGQDHWTHSQASSDESDPLLSTVRDLSLTTDGSYVGSTSNITLARILGPLLGGKVHDHYKASLPTWDGQEHGMGSSAISETGYHSLAGSDAVFSLMIPSDIAEKLIHAYIRRISGSFPVLHTAHIRDLYRRRAELEDPYERGILHLVFALGGRFLYETTGDNGDYQSEYHFEAALDKKDAILSLGDARTLIYLLLLAQQCLRIPKNMGAWTLVGFAMRLCVELGLHRRKRSKGPSIRSEMEKRLFWSCYYLDRELSISLGRPPAISNHDIDVELPLDVDEDTQDLEMFRKAAEADPSQPASPPNTLTYFIHLVRLKRIESEIQTTIYRVDRAPDTATSNRATDKFLERLAAWKDAIPPEKGNLDSSSSRPAYSADVYPQLYASVVNERYLQLCMEACSGVCETYKRIYHHTPMAFSALSLQNVFIAGLTLVYCIWYMPNSSAAPNSFSALTDCSIMLYVMTERWTSSRKYRDAFEGIKGTVLRLIADGNHQPRRTVTDMSADVRTTLQNLDTGMAENNRDDLEQMIADMTGEQLNFWGRGPDAERVGGGQQSEVAHLGSFDLLQSAHEYPLFMNITPYS
ncbi:hypothetical protein BP5796_10409 [Coleophoma crateriformis]|uniref:Zn(2)-C6 fungal-type domain-containing protein n=1 Tax=Coleophoma crateriformis TaxID=565419 RepID=A0A3D8QQ50_9HELO|nr:hypothetical protein BP5796_10409 [Coleophoma crateriformis]